MLLEIKNLDKAFGAVQALHDVNISCDRCEIHGLVGENGAGKSTLLKILAGVFAPDGGEVRFQGEPIRSFHPDAAMRRGVAIIHQELSLIPALTVAENIYIGHEHLGRFGRLDRKGMKSDAEKLLTRIGLSIDAGRRIGSLSVAEQQAVEIARALSREAKLLILDEPTAALADQEVDRLFVVLRDLRAQGTGVIFVSHRLYEVLRIADVITVLKDGHVVGTNPASTLDEHRLISMMVGRELAHTFPPKRPAGRDQVILELDRLSAHDGSFQDVSLRLHRGEIMGLAGLEGHGQRELLRAVFGLARLSGGRISVASRTLRRPTPKRCIRAGIVFLSDDRKGECLVLPFDMRENVCLATMKERQTLSYIHERAERKVANEIAAQLDIQPRRIDRLVRYLSGGNQQKVVLGRWLIAHPKVLLLSEPTRGIDVGTKVQIYNFLRKLADDGMGILVVSRDMIELLGLSDRIVVMADGRLVAELDGADATEKAIMRAIIRGSGGRVDWRDAVREAR